MSTIPNASSDIPAVVTQLQKDIEELKAKLSEQEKKVTATPTTTATLTQATVVKPKRVWWKLWMTNTELVTAFTGAAVAGVSTYFATKD